jgi:TolB-like protein
MKKALFCIFAMFTCMCVFAQQPVVAVAPFDAISGISSTEANMITRVFFIRLGNTGKVSLVDRGVVERVLQEHKFQAGDWSNQQKTAELGKALNTDWIVRGEMETFGNNILVTVQFYDIRTFRFMGGADLRLANADEAYDKMDPLVDKLVQTIARTVTRVTYKIGDKGPGGGIIFFARDGKYMECSGELGKTEYWSDAVRLVQNYSGGGFTNWRLPTREELNLIYVNLKVNNREKFINEFYWSSSENGSNNVWGIRFADGEHFNGTKGGNGQTRAVREF